MKRRVKTKNRPKDVEQSLAKRTKREQPSTDLLEEKMYRIGLKWLKITSAIAVIGLFVFLLMFFKSGISDRIVQSKQEMAYVAPDSSSNKEPSDKSPSNPSDKDISDKDPLDKDTVLAYLKSLTDNDFNAVKKVLIIELETMNRQGNENAGALLNGLKNGTITSKTDLIAYLEALTTDSFDSLVNDWRNSDVSTNHQSNRKAHTDNHEQNGMYQTLTDAYIEAEKRYPGKVNASKRLKLIEDLNNWSYLYYVAEQGDTLIALSQAFHVSLGQLVELNGIHDADVINAGEILLFPSDTKQPKIKDTKK